MKIKANLQWTSAERTLLGENPLWDGESATLYWIDVAGPAVYRLAGGTVTRFVMPKPVAALFLGTQGTLVVAMRQSLATLNLLDGQLTPIDSFAPPSAEERFNDGRCDRRGRAWISTMDRKLENGIGSLVRIDASGSASSLPTGARLGNGVCFSPDNSTLYFSDTSSRAIYGYAGADLDAMPASRTLFAQLGDAPGRPDGCSVDAEGCLWSARVGGGRIDRYAPDGRLIGWLETPVSHPTHCTFGGAGLSTLFVTSSRYPEGSAAFADQPLAGAVLAFDIGVKGLPENRFLLNSQGAKSQGVPS